MDNDKILGKTGEVLPENKTAPAGVSPPQKNKMPVKQAILFACSLIIVLFAAFYSEVLPHLQRFMFLYSEAYTMYFVGFCLFMLFLAFPATKKLREAKKDKIIWYDIVLGTIGMVACFYVAINWESIYGIGAISNTLFQKIMGWAVILIVLEATRRSVGIPMIIVAVVFLLYVFFGYGLKGFLHTTAFSSTKIIGYLYLSSEGIFGMPSQIVSTTVIAFITFGAFLSCSKAGEFFKNLAVSMMGSLRGGGAKVAVMCSMLFSTMTGDPVSNTGIVGPLTVPLMKKLDYDRVFSAATVAVSSCGSMIMPPVMAAVAFMMASMTGFGYTAVATAAVIPAVLYYCAVYWQIDFYSAKHGYKPIPKSEILTLGEALKSGWIYLIPIAVLIYFLLVVRWSPASAIYRSLVVLIAIAVIKKEDRKYFAARVKSAFMDAGISGLPTVCVSAASGIIMASVTMTGLGLRLSSSLEILANGNLMILAILAAACIYIMGMGMAPIVSYILMAILVAPAMVNMGVSVRDMHSSARHCAH